MKQNALSKFNQLFLSGLLLIAAPLSFAVDGIRTESIHFEKGAYSAVVEGSIKGYEIVDYLLAAHAGQSMSVNLATEHNATYFNILAPNENEVALFNGSIAQNHFEGPLPSDGEYKIRVYMLRAAARRDEVSRYRLEMAIDGKAPIYATSSDAKVTGTNFHATGQIRCSIGKIATMNLCSFGVEREKNGDAFVTIIKSDDIKRVIYFQSGVAIGYDQSQADTAELKAQKKGDLNIISIGDERYEIPDAVVVGG